MNDFSVRGRHRPTFFFLKELCLQSGRDEDPSVKQIVVERLEGCSYACGVLVCTVMLCLLWNDPVRGGEFLIIDVSCDGANSENDSGAFAASFQVIIWKFCRGTLRSRWCRL